MPVRFVISCEHGGNRIPRAYAPLFRRYRSLLQSHRGYDAGALTMARSLSRALGAVLIASTTSRLLVELNRSPGHRDLFSPVMVGASDQVRRAIQRRYYLPYRRKVEAAVRASLALSNRVVHIASIRAVIVVTTVIVVTIVNLRRGNHGRSHD